MKTRIRGGEGGTPRLGCPIRPSFGRVGLFAWVLWLGLPVFSQQAITDPAQLKSKSVENLQNFTVDKLYMTRDIGGTTWSPDGKQIAFVSNISGRNNIWTIPSSGGWPTQLTISDQRQVSPAWSPDGNWIAYASDYDGNEQWDVFLVSPKSGDVLNLTTTKEISEQSPIWSPDSKQLAYTTKPKDAASYEIDVIDVYTRHVRHLTQNTPANLSNFGQFFTQDGKSIAYTQARADGKDSNIYLFDFASGKSKNLTPHQSDHLYYVTDLSPDGKTALITSDAHNGYWNVGLLDITSGEINWLTNDKWETRSGTFSPDGRSLCWTSNVDGQTAIYSYDLASKQTAVPAPNGWREYSWRQSSSLLAGRIEAALLPPGRRLTQRRLDLRRCIAAVAAGDACADRRAAQRRHGSSPTSCTFPAAMASSPSRRLFMCRTTSRPMASFPPLCRSTAARPRSLSMDSIR